MLEAQQVLEAAGFVVAMCKDHRIAQCWQPTRPQVRSCRLERRLCRHQSDGRLTDAELVLGLGDLVDSSGETAEHVDVNVIGHSVRSGRAGWWCEHSGEAEDFGRVAGELDATP